MFKSLRPDGTAIDFDERYLSFVRHTAITLSGRQTHRHPFSASPFAVHAMGRDRSRAFQKHNLDFDLVFIASSPSVTAAMLGGDAEISLGGGKDRSAPTFRELRTLCLSPDSKTCSRTAFWPPRYKTTSGFEGKESRHQSGRQQSPLFCRAGAALRNRPG